MNENTQDRTSVYEIGYLLAGMPEERVSAEADAVKKVVTDAGASIIAEEAPKHEKLAYTMKKKTVSGSYDKYDEAYFGWVKFEASSDKIDGVKKAVEVIPSVLRMIVVTTVRENTYLGKRAPAAAAFPRRIPVAGAEGDALAATAAAKKDEKPAEPATIEEMDKSIDEMVKEV
jgi:ribosomal protein S6